jgi:hypothetical protein
MICVAAAEIISAAAAAGMTSVAAAGMICIAAAKMICIAAVGKMMQQCYVISPTTGPLKFILQISERPPSVG